ncbi:MAG: exodeoxyribonuclease VII large subunit, partial [SAR324 cluster bacterium]|nr:exodeoxyribonuclease VII large subunit [SAR324 cluster bacterium]
MPALIYPATVQGEKAAGEIAEGIAALNRLAEAQKIDVIIVGRGGGSVEDLWAFNEEIVARAIFASAVPIVSAVGHEVDFTIADFVADLRAPTPSAAAELVVPPRADLVATVVDLRERLLGRLADDLELGRERWSGLRARLASPDAAIRNLAQRTDDLRERIELAARGWLRQTAERLRQGRSALDALRPDRFNRLHRASVRSLERRLRPGLRRHLTLLRERVGAQMGLLDSLSPLTVMRRGYGAIRDKAGRLVRSVAQVKVGDALSLRLHDGTVEAETTGVTEEGEPQP